MGYMSSAGNTRGLIEASSRSIRPTGRLPSSAGIPAASLKREPTPRRSSDRRRLPRGIPAASLKPGGMREDRAPEGRVFRGEYPRPH